MNLSDAFPSKYLKSEDLNGNEVTVVIASVRRELVQNEEKTILTFQGKKKEMICNVTNGRRIAYLYGDKNIDQAWVGKEIVLAAEMVDFRGEPKLGLRVKPPAKRNGKADPGYQISSGPDATPVKKQPRTDEDMDQDIPF